MSPLESKYWKNFGFNQLTGLNQQVGNYPELRLRKIGFCKLPNNKANILDLPEHTV
jgi:Fe2+ transport system protein B